MQVGTIITAVNGCAREKNGCKRFAMSLKFLDVACRTLPRKINCEATLGRSCQCGLPGEESGMLRGVRIMKRTDDCAAQMLLSRAYSLAVASVHIKNVSYTWFR